LAEFHLMVYKAEKWQKAGQGNGSQMLSN
jgi:hypothetical protein